MQEISLTILDWRMAGRNAPQPSCGDGRTKFKDCSRVQLHDRAAIIQSCHDLDCYECHHRVSAKAGYKAIDRLAGLWKTAYIAGYDLGPFVHMMLSPPASEYSRFLDSRTYTKVQKEALKYLEWIGMIGSCYCLHQKRGKPDVLDSYKLHQLELDDSWHYHAIGFMPNGWKIKSDAFYEQTGWVYKNLGDKDFEAARGTISYQLSHASYYQLATGYHSQALKWAGRCANNQMKVIEDIQKSIESCSTCGADKHVYIDDYSQDQGEATKKIVTRTVTLTPGQLAKVASRIHGPTRPRAEILPTDQGVIVSRESIIQQMASLQHV